MENIGGGHKMTAPTKKTQEKVISEKEKEISKKIRDPRLTVRIRQPREEPMVTDEEEEEEEEEAEKKALFVEDKAGDENTEANTKKKDEQSGKEQIDESSGEEGAYRHTGDTPKFEGLGSDGEDNGSDGNQKHEYSRDELMELKLSEMERMQDQNQQRMDKVMAFIESLQTKEHEQLHEREEPSRKRRFSGEADKATREHLNAIKNAVPEFRGTDDSGISAHEFLRKAEMFLRSTPLRDSDACQHLNTKMVDLAGLWLERTMELVPDIEYNTKVFIQEFKRNYLPSDAKFNLIMRLLEEKQAGRTIEEYTREYLRKVAVVRGLPEEVRVAIYIHNMAQELRRQVQASTENVKDLQTATRIAQRLADNRGRIKTEALFSGHVKQFGRKRKTAPIDPKTICFRCNGTGHKSYECTKGVQTAKRTKPNPPEDAMTVTREEYDHLKKMEQKVERAKEREREKEKDKEKERRNTNLDFLL